MRGAVKTAFEGDGLERRVAVLEQLPRGIDANLFEPLSLSALAAEAGLSAFHFSRAFGARFGFSPMAYVRTRRLATAAVRPKPYCNSCRSFSGRSSSFV